MLPPCIYDNEQDGVENGAEPSPFTDLDVDGDYDINARDQDSNGDTGGDFDQAFVLFRTTATDAASDGKLDFGTDTEIATFSVDDPDIYSLSGSLTRYDYWQTTTLPEGCVDISVYFNEANAVVLRTPDNRSVYLKTGSPDKIYVFSSGDQFFEYVEDSGLSISGSIHVDWVNGHGNEVSNHQIMVDTRLATGDDTDCDGLRNSMDPNGIDRDTDDDGIPDGTDPDITDADCDGDGLTDGLETGVISTVPGIGTAVDGTNISSTFTWTVNGFNVLVCNFTADSDPTTVTDPQNVDTDGDGINDGIEDCDMTNLSVGDHTLESTDLNGKFDGFSVSETNPLDIDSDDDGIVDGTEDTDHDGLWDWDDEAFTGDTCAWRFDSDGDNLGDGMEIGKTLWNITLDTSTSIFKPDADVTTTTNPLAVDTDCDGVPDGYIDGWTCDPVNHPEAQFGKYNVPDMEFQFGEGEDKNLNGKYDPGETDPESKDSDGDHLADGWDIVTTTTLSDLFTTDTGEVKRYWGELNSTTHLLGTRGGTNVYQSNTTDPTNRDSDGDGLVDGNVELNDRPCELVTAQNGLSQTMYTDPSMMDTNSDGLSDGLEISGWQVHILRESTKQEVRNWTVNSNPTIIDTDSDGVNDYYEFENQSDPLKTDTDDDYILDCDESQGQLTQIDGSPPKYTKWDGAYFHVTFVKVYGSEYDGKICTKEAIEITFEVSDGAGIDHVEISLSGEGVKSQDCKGAKTIVVTIAFNCDDNTKTWLGWNFIVLAQDMNGNINKTDKIHIDSGLEGAVKAFVNNFISAVNWVAKALNLDWIWSCINGLLNNVLKPVTDALAHWKDELLNLGMVLYNNPGGKAFGDFQLIIKFIEANIIGGVLFLSALCIIIVLRAIMVLVTYASGGTATILIPAVADGVKLSLLKTIGYTLGTLACFSIIEMFLSMNGAPPIADYFVDFFGLGTWQFTGLLVALAGVAFEFIFSKANQVDINFIIALIGLIITTMAYVAPAIEPVWAIAGLIFTTIGFVRFHQAKRGVAAVVMDAFSGPVTFIETVGIYTFMVYALMNLNGVLRN